MNLICKIRLKALGLFSFPYFDLDSLLLLSHPHISLFVPVFVVSLFSLWVCNPSDVCLGRCCARPLLSDISVCYLFRSGRERMKI